MLQNYKVKLDGKVHRCVSKQVGSITLQIPICGKDRPFPTILTDESVTCKGCLRTMKRTGVAMVIPSLKEMTEGI